MARTKAEQIEQKFANGLFADLAKADQEAQAPEAPKKATRKPAGTKKTTQAKKSAPKPEEAIETKQEGKGRKNGRPFSVWLQNEDIESLQLYCEVTKMPVTKVVTSALRIFLAENRPSEEEKAAYFKELDSIKDKINYL